jgi:hypothetical protein
MIGDCGTRPPASPNIHAWTHPNRRAFLLPERTCQTKARQLVTRNGGSLPRRIVTSGKDRLLPGLVPACEEANENSRPC